MNKGLETACRLYDINFADKEDFDYLKNMGYMLQLISNNCSQNYRHCIRVSNFAMMMSNYFGMSEEEKKKLWSASILHDIGKMYTPGEILQKPESLTQGEYEEIKHHSYNGYYTIKLLSNYEDISEVVLNHHERYDGNGYPNGIRGEEIPFLSRILSVADAFDAMTSERSYKKKMSMDEALGELEKGKGTQFDGQVVDAFLQVVRNDDDHMADIHALVEYLE